MKPKQPDPPEKPPGITPEALEKIKAADIGNIIRRVKAGRPLTAQQRAQLEAMVQTPEPLDGDLVTQTRLCEIFNVSRAAVAGWRRAGRNVPAKVGRMEPLPAWRDWFNANPDAGKSNQKVSRTKEALQCEKLEIDIARATIDLDIARGKLIPADEARESMTRVVSGARSFFLKIPGDLAPQLEGLPAATIQRKLRAAIVEVLTMLSRETAEIYQKPETKS